MRPEDHLLQEIPQGVELVGFAVEVKNQSRRSIGFSCLGGVSVSGSVSLCFGGHRDIHGVQNAPLRIQIQCGPGPTSGNVVQFLRKQIMQKRGGFRAGYFQHAAVGTIHDGAGGFNGALFAQRLTVMPGHTGDIRVWWILLISHGIRTVQQYRTVMRSHTTMVALDPWHNP